MSWVKRLKKYCPPALLGPIKRISPHSVRYSGGYSSWAEALSHTSGYDTDLILSRVVAATRKVIAGEAAFERDSVLFDRLECPFHLLVPMLRAAIDDDRRLSILDYGGSLGSTYRQCRPFLGPVSLSWNIVEQNSFVQAGKAEFESAELRFFESPEQIPQNRAANVLLFSGVLQYLEQPFEALRMAARGVGQYLIIDRMPFVGGRTDYICVQHVPRRIYPASYPAWIFGYDRVLEALGNDWSLMAEFVSPEGHASASGGLAFEFRGLILQRKHLE